MSHLARTSRALLVLLAGLALALSTAGTAQAVAPVDRNHPYSAPAWYPLLQSASVMDCVVSNPGCPSGHTDQSMTLGTQGVAQPVSAAGAGIVHIGADSTPDNVCPASGSVTLGNWIWIDHGDGVLSRYSHLQRTLRVTEGQYVAVGTVLGLTGNSGAVGRSCPTLRYLNFQLQHGAKDGVGTAFALTTLKGCTRPGSAEAVAYPTFTDPAYTKWNDVPQGTVIAQSGTDCLPTTAPNTPPSPRDVALVNNGPGRLKFTWTKPTTGPTIKYVSYEFQYYSTSLKRWAYVDPTHPYVTITVGTTFPTTRYFLDLHKGTQYRARVWFNGGDGWSLEGYWKTATST